jgi:hypothetical protein
MQSCGAEYCIDLVEQTCELISYGRQLGTILGIEVGARVILECRKSQMACLAAAAAADCRPAAQPAVEDGSNVPATVRARQPGPRRLPFSEGP